MEASLNCLGEEGEPQAPLLEVLVEGAGTLDLSTCLLLPRGQLLRPGHGRRSRRFPLPKGLKPLSRC